MDAGVRQQDDRGQTMSDGPPLQLRVNGPSGLLEIDWSGGSTSAIAFRTLRERCLCAECRSARQQGRTIAVCDGISLSEIVPYGTNAVQLTFSDGHTRGIFPFSYLRELASRGTTTADTR